MSAQEVSSGATASDEEVRVDVECFLIVGDEPPKPIVISVFYNPMRRKPPLSWLEAARPMMDIGDEAPLGHRVLAELDA